MAKNDMNTRFHKKRCVISGNTEMYSQQFEMYKTDDI